ncbi:hypothetical protein [Alicyclobacillus mengziensis]|uniref:Uncharacterized protein n=1 Tax=Alicyclobacillus mengziensis TaxID=2931921 RepID=A0A9X7VZS8_9BACL|nr:hypothetical protein [Alicyclobacillus mengziensis]QSO47714.1 hypothetical protein JZ786_01260 [Alicyclobacillus mengziensis]
MVQQVTNYSRTKSLAVIDVGVNYNTDLQRAFDVAGIDIPVPQRVVEVKPSSTTLEPNSAHGRKE